MNPNDQRAWDRLVRGARQAPRDEDLSAPFGFATQVVARAFAQEPLSISALIARLSARALFVAGILAVASLALNYSAISSNPTADAVPVLDDDPVVVLMGLS